MIFSNFISGSKLEDSAEVAECAAVSLGFLEGATQSTVNKLCRLMQVSSDKLLVGSKAREVAAIARNNNSSNSNSKSNKVNKGDNYTTTTTTTTASDKLGLLDGAQQAVREAEQQQQQNRREEEEEEEGQTITTTVSNKTSTTSQDNDARSSSTTSNSSRSSSSGDNWQLECKYTMSEVQQHSSLDDCWMVIFDKVYNITEFVDIHPGGDFILLEYAGRDATHPFLSSRHGSSAYKMLDKYWIGILVDEELYYSNNSSYCSVYSNLSWRSGVSNSSTP